MKYFKSSTSILVTSILLLSHIACHRNQSIKVEKEASITWLQLKDLTLPNNFFKHIPLENQKNINYSLFTVDQSNLYNLLSAVPDNKVVNALDSKSIINFPHPNGALIPFKIVSTTLMEKELADKFPELKTYEGVSALADNTLIRVTINKLGIDAMILSPEGTYFIHFIKLNEQSLYLVYFK